MGPLVAPAAATPAPAPSATSSASTATGNGSELSASTLTPLAAARKKPKLHYRSRGLAVIYVQQRLGVRPVSGYYGPLTRAAVRALQRSEGIKVTGTTTRKTWKLLLAGAQEQPAADPTPAPDASAPTPSTDPADAAAAKPTLRYGMGPGDAAVVYVQKYLSVEPTSGYFGRLTRGAVKAYQKGMGIRATGVVGPLTWAAILAGKRPGDSTTGQPATAVPVDSPSADPASYRYVLPKKPTPADLAVAFAMQQVGERYVLGGNGPDVWDCSGLVQQAYLSVGISLPRRASQQQHAGTRVDVKNLRPGDLLYYQDGPSTRRGHISMYAGNGMAVEAANPRRGVRVRELNEPWYAKRFVVAVRLV